jgi:leucyl aminopeptidase
MHSTFLPLEEPSIPIYVVEKKFLSNWAVEQSTLVQAWINSSGFHEKKGKICLIPNVQGHLDCVVFIYDPQDSFWEFAQLGNVLPTGPYSLKGDLSCDLKRKICFAWGMSSYSFDQYKETSQKSKPRLCWPEGVDQQWVEGMIRATSHVRDLINTPASDLGPTELAETMIDLATTFEAASCTLIEDSGLLEKNYPAIYTVGKASSRSPILIDFSWQTPCYTKKITLVGKGVCFDSGGLDIKSAHNMLLMKKDMGGAAHVIALAYLIMKMNLPVNLRVLIPAVENSISGNAMRPLDVIRMRKGCTVEIGDTDAEGRLILADALWEASSDDPDLIIDCATLTGAARIALGTDVPAVFSNSEKLVCDLLNASEEEDDPLWRLPLYHPYKKLLKSSVADMSSTSKGGYGGAITAALFLEHFVKSNIPWIHMDMMAWNTSSSPGRPEGGEAMGLRALYRFVSSFVGE